MIAAVAAAVIFAVIAILSVLAQTPAADHGRMGKLAFRK